MPANPKYVDDRTRRPCVAFVILISSFEQAAGTSIREPRATVVRQIGATVDDSLLIAANSPFLHRAKPPSSLQPNLSSPSFPFSHSNPRTPSPTSPPAIAVPPHDSVLSSSLNAQSDRQQRCSHRSCTDNHFSRIVLE